VRALELRAAHSCRSPLRAQACGSPVSTAAARAVRPTPSSSGCARGWVQGRSTDSPCSRPTGPRAAGR
jgi:hypothetical protein